MDERGDEIGKGMVLRTYGEWYGLSLETRQVCVVDVMELSGSYDWRKMMIPYKSDDVRRTFGEANKISLQRSRLKTTPACRESNEDDLFISCVASAANLWAIIKDAGTGFSSQVYELSSVFLHTDWIMEQWEKNYYISSIAGANNGISLVVMAKGTSYTQQSYKVSDSFPFKWINKKWKEGFHVTSMTTAGSRWGVVMSRNSGYSEQVVELDFLYPSEGIHRRWESGYRITSMAATADQAALICYGRTVC